MQRFRTFVERPSTLGWILLGAILVRALYVLGAWLASRDPSVFTGPDTITYVNPARELLERGTFSVNGTPELVRTPGYPLLLLPGLWLGHLAVVTISIQILLGALTTLGVCALARRVFGSVQISHVAAALYAVEPLSIAYTAIIATETLFATLTVWGLVLIVEYVRVDRVAALIGGAALLAAATYVRPAGYYLPFGLFALLAVLSAVRRDWRRVGQCVLGACVAAAVVIPWRARNSANGYHGMSAISAVNMYYYNGAAILAARNGSSYYEMQA